MQTIKRRKSMLTGCETEELFSLKNFPVFMLEDRTVLLQPTCDMEFEIGKEDGFVQLGNVIPPEILYKDPHSNAIGAVWEGMHKLVAEKISENSNSNTRILEIGGGMVN